MVPLSRRKWLQQSACGFGHTALLGLLAGEPMPGEARAAGATGSALTAKAPHFPARAKRVVFLFMHGGISHVDSFDPKPKLAALNGQPLPLPKPKFEFAPTGNLLASPWEFRRYGQSGLEISDLFPLIGSHADDLCVIRSMHGGDQVSHGPALLAMNTGSGVFSRPSLGAWTLYGLGSENDNLPGFISLSPSLYHGGTQNYGAAFLPASFQGTRIGDGSTDFKSTRLSNLVSAEDPALERLKLDLLAARNRRHAALAGGDPRLEARIESFELAYRMQAEAPEAFDLTRETAAMHRLYGTDRPDTELFGRQCLLARRLVERGVRFVQLFDAPFNNAWDHHGGLRDALPKRCRAVDQPVAALLGDLKARGLLDDTLVVWGGEFGRTPTAEGTDGREHHPFGFTMWLAGGGVRGGMVHGATDEFGWHAERDVVHIHDLHATILHLMGLDHERLTVHWGGRDYRLTDVHGRIVRPILA